MYHITWNISPHIFLIKKYTWVMCNSKCTTWKLAQHQIFLDYEITNKIVLMIDLVRNVWRPKVLWCLTTKSLWKESWDFQFPKKKKDLSRLNLDNCKSIWVYVEEKNLLKETYCLVYIMIFLSSPIVFPWCPDGEFVLQNNRWICNSISLLLHFYFLGSPIVFPCCSNCGFVLQTIGELSTCQQRLFTL